jgi:hypothetical protein
MLGPPNVFRGNLRSEAITGLCERSKIGKCRVSTSKTLSRQDDYPTAFSGRRFKMNAVDAISKH